jgi:hypothetical protein
VEVGRASTVWGGKREHEVRGEDRHHPGIAAKDGTVVNGSKRRLPWAGRAALAVVVTAAWLLPSLPTPARADTIDEIHYAYTSATSVTFDWRGSANDMARVAGGH